MVLLVSSGAKEAAASIVNGSFESPVVPVVADPALRYFQYPGGSSAISGWTVVGDNILLLQTTFGESGPPFFTGVDAFNAQDALNSVDLTGGANTNSSTNGIEQAVATTAGTLYHLQFYVGRAQSNNGDSLYQTPVTLDLSLNGGTRTSFVNDDAPVSGFVNWKQFTTAFVATGPSTTIAFLNGTPTVAGGGANFLGLDNVTLEAAVPEPSTLVLAGLGMAGLGILAWRRRRCQRHGFVARAVPGLMAALALLGSQNVNASELLINGSFETPVVPPSPPSNKFLTVNAGAEPAGFGWTVEFSNVEIVAQGYIGGGGTLPFDGPAYHADQWLDLDGYPSPGAISQTFATVSGAPYALSFAYANNPYRGSDASATVSVRNVADNVDLITPLLITHGNSEPADYHWTPSGTIVFIAQGPSTKLMFVSNDPSDIHGDAGIFLDAISVAEAPEPSTLVLAGLGLSGLGLLAWRRKRNAECGSKRADGGLRWSA